MKTPKRIRVNGHVYVRADHWKQVEQVDYRMMPQGDGTYRQIRQQLYKVVDDGSYLLVSYSPAIDETTVFRSDADWNKKEQLGEAGGKTFDGALKDAGFAEWD